MGHSTLNHGPWISNDLPLGALKKAMEPGSTIYILPSFHMESPNKLQGHLSLKVRFISILKSCQILWSFGMTPRHLNIWTTINGPYQRFPSDRFITGFTSLHYSTKAEKIWQNGMPRKWNTSSGSWWSSPEHAESWKRDHAKSNKVLDSSIADLNAKISRTRSPL